MRHLPTIVGAALLSAVLLAPSSHVDAAMLSLDRPDTVSPALEKVGYYVTTGPAIDLTATTVLITVHTTGTGGVTAGADLIAIATSKRRGHRSGPGMLLRP